ncbi:uncharacterized protein J3R85_001243 [Psidium guajava]|nr:uncharacterized protein J3R85_001243 [Psidium guajava]
MLMATLDSEINFILMTFWLMMSSGRSNLPPMQSGIVPPPGLRLSSFLPFKMAIHEHQFLSSRLGFHPQLPKSFIKLMVHSPFGIEYPHQLALHYGKQILYLQYVEDPLIKPAMNTNSSAQKSAPSQSHSPQPFVGSR